MRIIKKKKRLHNLGLDEGRLIINKGKHTLDTQKSVFHAVNGHPLVILLSVLFVPLLITAG